MYDCLHAEKKVIVSKEKDWQDVKSKNLSYFEFYIGVRAIATALC